MGEEKHMSKMLTENNAIACSLVQEKRGVATSWQTPSLSFWYFNFVSDFKKCEKGKNYILYRWCHPY